MYKKIILTFYLGFFSCISSAGEFGKWANYIPKSGVTKADVMLLDFSVEVQSISLRLQEMMKKDPEWFKTYILKASPGKPLPYHKKLGLTEAEYSAYLAGINKIKLIKSGEATIYFSQGKDRKVRLSGLPGKPPHDTLTYDIESNEIITAVAKLTENSVIEQNNKESATGRWKGEQWKYSKTLPETEYTSVKFAIGKLTDQAKNIIYYDITLTVHGEPRELSYVLLYDAE